MSDDFQRQVREHLRVMETVGQQAGILVEIADRIIRAFESDRKLLILGNGGSAADAQHIAAELVGRFKRDRKPLPAIALTTDTSTLTAVANDLGYDQVFSRQVQALARPGDVVLALSVSGTSPNVLAAMKDARAGGADCIGFTGSKGQELVELCDICFVVDHDQSDRVQEAHGLAYHLVCDRIEERFAG